MTKEFQRAITECGITKKGLPLAAEIWKSLPALFHFDARVDPLVIADMIKHLATSYAFNRQRERQK